MTARGQGRGEQALKNMLNDEMLLKDKALTAQGGLADVKFHPLDVSNDKSIHDFAAFLKETHPDGIDFGLMHFYSF